MGSDGGPMLSESDKSGAKNPTTPLSALKLSNVPSTSKRNREHQVKNNDQTPQIVQNGITEEDDTQKGKLITTERKIQMTLVLILFLTMI